MRQHYAQMRFKGRRLLRSISSGIRILNIILSILHIWCYAGLAEVVYSDGAVEKLD